MNVVCEFDRRNTMEERIVTNHELETDPEKRKNAHDRFFHDHEDACMEI